MNNNTILSNKICHQAYLIYSKYETWHDVIAMLKALATNAFNVNNTEDGENYDNKILNEIPYKDEPSGFQIQQIVEVLFMRMARQAFDKAKTLVDEIRDRPDSAPMSELLDGVEADLCCQKGDYAEALPYFCKQWERTLNSQSLARIEQLKSRFRIFEENLGRECLESLLAGYLEGISQSPLNHEYSLH